MYGLKPVPFNAKLSLNKLNKPSNECITSIAYGLGTDSSVSAERALSYPPWEMALTA
jgi:hypothetical protein